MLNQAVRQLVSKVSKAFQPYNYSFEINAVGVWIFTTTHTDAYYVEHIIKEIARNENCRYTFEKLIGSSGYCCTIDPYQPFN